MGDHHTKEPKDAEEVKEVQKVAKDAKGIQTMVRSLLFQAQDILPSSSRNCPVCVHFSTQDPSKVFACNILPSSLRSQLSNKTSCKPFGDHLLGQTAQKFRLRIPALNLA